jgi:hypothetical protein
MIAHLWSSGRENGELLVLEPVTGVDATGRLRTTTYNDFPNLRWIGARRGETRVFADAMAGRWTCFEARVRLNTPGRRDGVFEAWINDRLEQSRHDLDWVGSWTGFGLNGIFLENWQNAGSRTAKSRSFDNLVVSTERIGCGGAGGAGERGNGVTKERRNGGMGERGSWEIEVYGPVTRW